MNLFDGCILLENIGELFLKKTFYFSFEKIIFCGIIIDVQYAHFRKVKNTYFLEFEIQSSSREMFCKRAYQQNKKF